MVRAYAFTERVRQALEGARKTSNQLGTEYVGVEHLLLATLDVGGDQFERMLTSSGSSSQRVREAVLSRLQPGSARPASTDLPYTSKAKQILEGAMDEAARSAQDAVDLEHLLLAIVKSPGITTQAFADAQVDREHLRATICEATGTDEKAGLLRRLWSRLRPNNDA